MTACDLKKSFIFDIAIKLEITYTFQFVYEQILANLYLPR